jgi:hypothetical protein
MITTNLPRKSNIRVRFYLPFDATPTRLLPDGVFQNLSYPLNSLERSFLPGIAA